MNSSYRFMLALLAARFLFAATGSALAAPIFWDGNSTVPFSGNYHIAANWNPNVVPGAGDTAQFTALPNPYVVAFTGNAVSDAVELFTGVVTFQSNSTTPRTYDVAGALVAQGGSILNVVSGQATPKPMALNVGLLKIGTGAGSGTVVVSGDGAELNTNGSTINNVGVAGSTGTLVYANSAKGDIGHQLSLAESISNTTVGYVNVFTGAELTTDDLVLASKTSDATATLTVDGTDSTLTQSGASDIVLGSTSGGTGMINVQNGGVFNTGTGTTTVNATGVINIDDGTFNANGTINIDDGGRFNIHGSLNVNSGASVTATSDLGITPQTGPVVIFINHATFSAGAFTSYWSAFNGRRLTASYVNTASGSFDSLTLRASGTDSDAEVVIQSESTLSVSELLKVQGTSGGSSSVLVSGDFPGEESMLLTERLLVGGSGVLAGRDTSEVRVYPNGRLIVGTSTTLEANGTIYIHFGYADLNTVIDKGGTINYSAGSLSLNNLVLGPSGPLTGGNYQTMSENFRMLNVTENLVVPGGVSLTVEGNAVSGGTLQLLGGTLTGGMRSSSHPTLAMNIQAGTGSTIHVDSPIMIVGKSSSVSGFYTNGTVNVGANMLNILDANDAVFDSGALLNLGDNVSPGTINSANGLTLDFGGNIVGFGTVNTPDDSATPLINNGHITGSDPNDTITLTGYVKGVGTLDNVVITGTDAPGFSPATVIRGSVGYEGTLEIEIGGTSPGSGYDQLNHILGAGIADLGGTLDVSLINDFTPSIGDTFEILTATAVQDAFDTELLPTLAGDLQWVVDYQPSGVSLLVSLPGDFDFDFDVDGHDFLEWQRGEVSIPPSAEDLALWEEQFGNTSTFSLSTSAPEPSTLLLSLLGLSALCITRRRSRA
jgi:hypothetical protein